MREPNNTEEARVAATDFQMGGRSIELVRFTTHHLYAECFNCSPSTRPKISLSSEPHQTSELLYFISRWQTLLTALVLVLIFLAITFSFFLSYKNPQIWGRCHLFLICSQRDDGFICFKVKTKINLLSRICRCIKYTLTTEQICSTWEESSGHKTVLVHVLPVTVCSKHSSANIGGSIGRGQQPNWAGDQTGTGHGLS